MELYKLSALELSGLLAKKKVSAAEVCRSVLDRTDKAEPKVGAFITRMDGQAVSAAEKIDSRRLSGEALPPLAGVPIAHKDNVCVEGTRMTCGSKMLESFVPPYSATVAELLESAGTVLTGKLNLDEFAMGSACRTSPLADTFNPHDTSRVAGGSSGGSAAALAAGEIPLALGSDTGGSIRGPAAYCGVVGLKPTYGAVSRYGVVPFASSLDQVGAMARTVADTAMLFDAMRGRDKRDATSHAAPYGKITIDGLPKNLRIGVSGEFLDLIMSDEVKAALMAAAGTFEKLGAEVLEVSMPSMPYALPAYYVISSAEGSSNLARFDGVRYGYRAENITDLNDLYFRSRTEAFGDEVKRRIMLGTYVLSSGAYDSYYGKACEVAGQVRHDFEDAFKKCDLILAPATPTTAPKAGRVQTIAETYASDIFTVGVNLAGLPALSMPCALDGQSMPIGLQLIGPRWSEPAIFNAAAAFEQTTGLAGRLAVIAGVDA